MAEAERVKADTENQTDQTTETTETVENPDAVGLKKALDAERKAARDARKQVRDFEAQLTELTSKSTQLEEKLAAAESKIADYETAEKLRGWKSEIASEYGVEASLLRGSTKSELTEHAQQIKSHLKTVQAYPILPKQGYEPAPPALNDDTMLNGLRKIVGI